MYSKVVTGVLVLFISLTFPDDSLTQTTVHSELSAYLSLTTVNMNIRGVLHNMRHCLENGSGKCIMRHYTTFPYTGRLNKTLTFYCGVISVFSKTRHMSFTLIVHRNFWIKSHIIKFDAAWTGPRCVGGGMIWREFDQEYKFCGRRHPWTIITSTYSADIKFYGTSNKLWIPGVKLKLFFYNVKHVNMHAREVTSFVAVLYKGFEVYHNSFQPLVSWRVVTYLMFELDITIISHSSNPSQIMLHDGPGPLAPIVSLTSSKIFQCSMFSSNAFISVATGHFQLLYFAKHRNLSNGILQWRGQTAEQNMDFIVDSKVHVNKKHRNSMVHYGRIGDMALLKVWSPVLIIQNVRRFVFTGPTSSSQSINLDYTCEYGGLFIYTYHSLDQVSNMKLQSARCDNNGEYQYTARSYDKITSIVIMVLFIPGYSAGSVSVSFGFITDQIIHCDWSKSHGSVNTSNAVIEMPWQFLSNNNKQLFTYTVGADKEYLLGPSKMVLAYKSEQNIALNVDHVMVILHSIHRHYLYNNTYTFGSNKSRIKELWIPYLQNITIKIKYIQKGWHFKISLNRHMCDNQKRNDITKLFNTTIFLMECFRKIRFMYDDITIIYSEKTWDIDSLQILYITYKQSVGIDSTKVNVKIEEFSKAGDTYSSSVDVFAGKNMSYRPMLKAPVMTISIKMNSECTKKYVCRVSIVALGIIQSTKEKAPLKSNKGTVFCSAR